MGTSYFAKFLSHYVKQGQFRSLFIEQGGLRLLVTLYRYTIGGGSIENYWSIISCITQPHLQPTGHYTAQYLLKSLLLRFISLDNSLYIVKEIKHMLLEELVYLGSIKGDLMLKLNLPSISKSLDQHFDVTSEIKVEGYQTFDNSNHHKRPREGATIHFSKDQKNDNEDVNNCNV